MLALTIWQSLKNLSIDFGKHKERSGWEVAT